MIKISPAFGSMIFAIILQNVRTLVRQLMMNVKNSLHNVPLQEINVLPLPLVIRQLISKVVELALMELVGGCLLKNVRNSKLVRMQLESVLLNALFMEVIVLQMVPNVPIRVNVQHI